MKLWVDKEDTAPEGYVWCKNADDARIMIQYNEILYAKSGGNNLYNVESIDIVPHGDTYLASVEFREWLAQSKREHYVVNCHGCHVTKEHELIADMINDYFGCDAGYYDIDALALANHLLQNGVKVCPAADNVCGSDMRKVENNG